MVNIKTLVISAGVMSVIIGLSAAAAGGLELLLSDKRKQVSIEAPVQRVPYEQWATQEGYRPTDIVLDDLKELNCGKPYHNTAITDDGSTYTVIYSPQEGLSLEARFSDTQFAPRGTIVEHQALYNIDKEGNPVPIDLKNADYRNGKLIANGQRNGTYKSPVNVYLSGEDPHEELLAYDLMFYRQGVKGLTTVYNEHKGKNCSR